MKWHVRQCRGVSATEVIFSLFLLTILVVLVMNLLPASMLGVRQSQQKLQAEEIAQSTLDAQMVRPFPELTLGTQALQSVKLDNRVYELNMTVANHETEPSDRLRKIIITVSWNHRGHRKELKREMWRADVER